MIEEKEPNIRYEELPRPLGVCKMEGITENQTMNKFFICFFMKKHGNVGFGQNVILNDKERLTEKDIEEITASLKELNDMDDRPVIVSIYRLGDDNDE